MINLPDLRNADVRGKKVLLRADIDIPFNNGKIMDDRRLRESLETLNFLLENGALVILAGHLGRPEGKDEKLSVKPIAQWYQNKLKIKNDKLKMTKIRELDGWKISNNLYLLENLRFDPGEESNDPDFAKKLAGLSDIYVNDAFAVSHREHASIVGVAKLLPHFAGVRLIKEVETLSSLLENPKRPLVVIIGGAKIETKLPLVEKMHQFADYVLVGGKIAEETRVLLKVQHEKVKERKSVLLVADLNPDETDTTEKSAENFPQKVSLAEPII